MLTGGYCHYFFTQHAHLHKLLMGDQVEGLTQRVKSLYLELDGFNPIVIFVFLFLSCSRGFVPQLSCTNMLGIEALDGLCTVPIPLIGTPEGVVAAAAWLVHAEDVRQGLHVSVSPQAPAKSQNSAKTQALASAKLKQGPRPQRSSQHKQSSQFPSKPHFLISQQKSMKGMGSTL